MISSRMKLNFKQSFFHTIIDYVSISKSID